MNIERRIGSSVLAVACASLWLGQAQGDPATSSDPFTPHMPQVKNQVAAEIGSIFRQALTAAATQGVVVVTPDRQIGQFPTKAPTRELQARGRELSSGLFGAAAHGLHIVVVSYTDTKALLADKTFMKCIPFAGMLIGLGFAGHRVVVFEGHPSALPIALRGADVLMLDDGMKPFLQPDWETVARKALKPAGRILIHRRADFKLVELLPPE